MIFLSVKILSVLFFFSSFSFNSSKTGYNIVNLNGVNISAENEKTVMYYRYIGEVHMAVTYGIFVSIYV